MTTTHIMDLIEIQQLQYDNINLVLPSLNDIKLFLLNNTDIFDMLLQNKVKITAILVMKNSKMHTTAVHNKTIVNS